MVIFSSGDSALWYQIQALNQMVFEVLCNFNMATLSKINIRKDFNLIGQSSYKIGFNVVTQVIKITLEIAFSMCSDLAFLSDVPRAWFCICSFVIKMCAMKNLGAMPHLSSDGTYYLHYVRQLT